MTRKQTLLLALAGVVAVLIGTRIAIVFAQQGLAVDRPPSADNVPRPTGYVQPVPATPSNGFFASPAPMLPMMGSAAGAVDDPEMAELMQSEATLARGAEDLVAKYAETQTAAERKEIAAELRNTLAKQFDAQRQRREIELRRIEEHLRKLREQAKKRDDARETIIDRRREQLLNEAEGLGWAPATGARPRGGDAMSPDGMMRRMPPATPKAAPSPR
jgi:hypothetical protein